MKVADTLIRIASTRERAYRSAGRLSLDKAEAISKIKRTASMYKGKKESLQYHAVRLCSGELFLIAPSEQSRFKNLRSQILNLISTAYEPSAPKV